MATLYLIKATLTAGHGSEDVSILGRANKPLLWGEERGMGGMSAKGGLRERRRGREKGRKRRGCQGENTVVCTQKKRGIVKGNTVLYGVGMYGRA